MEVKLKEVNKKVAWRISSKITG